MRTPRPIASRPIAPINEHLAGAVNSPFASHVPAGGIRSKGRHVDPEWAI